MSSDILSLAVYLGFGVVSAFVGGMTGLGGGFLLIPLLTMIAQLDIKDAIFLSLSCILWLSILRMHKNRETLRQHSALFRKFLLVIFAGAALASVVGSRTPSDVLHKIFAGLMIATAAYFFIDRKHDPKHAVQKSSSSGFASILFFTSGFLGGLLGIGGGIINVPTLHKLLRFPMHQATQLSFPLVFVSALSALLVTFHQRKELTAQISPLILLALLVGTFLGSHLASLTKVSAEKLKLLFAAVIGLIGVFKLLS